MVPSTACSSMSPRLYQKAMCSKAGEPTTSESAGLPFSTPPRKMRSKAFSKYQRRCSDAYESQEWNRLVSLPLQKNASVETHAQVHDSCMAGWQCIT
eukprot:1157263-Pelagomonas_calceolata.AAC.8